MKVVFKNLIKLKDTKTLSHPEFSVLIKQQPARLNKEYYNIIYIGISWKCARDFHFCQICAVLQTCVSSPQSLDSPMDSPTSPSFEV